MTDKPHGAWYVSFETPRNDKRKFARATETFANEREARQFAKAKLVDTDNITAGTLNPYRPRRIVIPIEVPDWIEEPD